MPSDSFSLTISTKCRRAPNTPCSSHPLISAKGVLAEQRTLLRRSPLTWQVCVYMWRWRWSCSKQIVIQSEPTTTTASGRFMHALTLQFETYDRARRACLRASTMRFWRNYMVVTKHSRAFYQFCWYKIFHHSRMLSRVIFCDLFCRDCSHRIVLQVLSRPSHMTTAEDTPCGIRIDYLWSSVICDGHLSQFWSYVRAREKRTNK